MCASERELQCSNALCETICVVCVFVCNGGGVYWLAFLPLRVAVTLSMKRGADTVLVVFRVSR